MNQIAQQLKEEVDSLREYIQRTEERLLVSSWVGQMISPFEDTEHQFDQEELSQVVGALYKARHQFSVNGHLGDRLDSIIERYSHLFTNSASSDDEDPIPAKDPQNDNILDFVEDEEDEDDSTPTLFEPFIADTAATISESSESSGLSVLATEKDRNFPIAHDHRNNAVFDLFSKEEHKDQPPQSPPVPKHSVGQHAPLPDGAAADLFAQHNAQPTAKTRANKNKAQKPSRRDGIRPPVERPSKIRQSSERVEEKSSQYVDIFSERIAVEDLLLDMDIRIPEQDKVQLTHSLKNKLSSNAVTALQKNPQAEGQYVLIPRISRFIFDGNLYPCTIKSLARTYIAFFGDIKDLMQYKGMPFLNHDTPKLGWTLITKEAAQETCDKNFMEQAQYLRYLATSMGVPTHLVRRRTLVETIYDMIVGRMVLKTTFLKHTLDWTSDGPNKSEFVCAYFSERGIRLRHLPRTQHNRALGFCPNW